MPESTEKLMPSIGAKASLGEIKNQKISEIANCDFCWK
jgi:hypothetical protein